MDINEILKIITSIVATFAFLCLAGITLLSSFIKDVLKGDF